jgi:hypothetical protein
MFAETLSDVLQKQCEEVLKTKVIPQDVQLLETDNLGEIIEKLMILHIRCWMLEDAIQQAESDAEIADLKKKIDICFKTKRPRLVQAVNLYVNHSIATGRSIVEDNVKLYKGVS